MGDGGRDVKDDQSGFQYVGKTIKANRRRRKGRDRDVEEDEEKRLARRIEIIKAKQVFLLEGCIGKQMTNLLDQVFPLATSDKETPSSILMLGLGNVSTSRASQVQLAFLLLTRDRLQKIKGNTIPVEAFDPVFNADDRQLLSSFDIQIGNLNKQGKYAFDDATFVYMPHCTKSIYENILRCNWTQKGLQRMWLCCNDLERYTHFRHQDAQTPCIDRIVPYLSVKHIPLLPAPHDTALNDLTIQRFDSEGSTAFDNLADQLEKIRLQSKKSEDNSIISNSNFWTLPELQNDASSDPELL